ncbi:MAG TPA: sigma-70 family RNA polymerase sigma factor [Polyangiaceae bacterium]|jgi:DNA-directed RNA polymerase specialized sigma24 family protein
MGAAGGDWKGADFRQKLVGLVRRQVPEREVEDIVQATLAEALSPAAPLDEESLRRWLVGVAKNKIADLHRRGRRESFEVPEVAVEAPPHAERDLVRWAESALPADGGEQRQTLEWLLREGEGEKLESIAESEQIPAPRVRKRVSRLRAHLRAQWRKEVALLAALGIAAVLVWLAQREKTPVAKDEVRPVPSEVTPSPKERARVLRDEALAACGREEWGACLEGLDRAKGIDPEGEKDPVVQRARAAAESAVVPVAPPTLAPAPSASGMPAPRPTSVPSVPTVPRQPSKKMGGGSSI